jgi:hypothetical protein
MTEVCETINEQILQSLLRLLYKLRATWRQWSHTDSLNNTSRALQTDLSHALVSPSAGGHASD